MTTESASRWLIEVLEELIALQGCDRQERPWLRELEEIRQRNVAILVVGRVVVGISVVRGAVNIRHIEVILSKLEDAAEIVNLLCESGCASPNMFFRETTKQTGELQNRSKDLERQSFRRSRRSEGLAVAR